MGKHERSSSGPGRISINLDATNPIRKITACLETPRRDSALYCFHLQVLTVLEEEARWFSFGSLEFLYPIVSEKFYWPDSTYKII